MKLFIKKYIRMILNVYIYKTNPTLIEYKFENINK
jgi:hypothetical protein